MDYQQAALAICGTTVAYGLYKRYLRISINDVAGPENPSWVYGHTWFWQGGGADAVEVGYMKKYGAIFRWNGPLGEDRLWVADPKAIHHILQGSNTLYKKPYAQRERTVALLGRGLVSAEDDTHKRQRRAMTPAFGLIEAKALYPYFSRCSNSLADKWHEIISDGKSGQAAIVDVQSWFCKATLDAIGAGAFDYDFGAVEGTDNEFTKSYTNLIFSVFGRLTKRDFFFMDALEWAPKGFVVWMYDKGKSPGMVKLQKNKMHAHEVAATLIENKRQELRDGTPRKDLLSLLVKANSALRPDWRLNDDEIIAQVRTIMFAGHETTARTLTFVLWELAKKRHVQERLRAEIMETLLKVRARGDSDFTVNDFDSMSYLTAVVKETLRLYPAVTEMRRVPKEDSVLPLAKPIIGISGKVYNELPVPAGTTVTISLIGYNMNKDVWGQDAYEFRPDRWFEMNEKPELPIGVYGNLATFSGGHRSCIGWRFAVIEMHSFLVTLVRQFDFSLPDNGQEAWVKRSGMSTPIVVGEEHKGPQMPLTVRVIENE